MNKVCPVAVVKKARINSSGIDAFRPEVASTVFDGEVPEEEEVSDEQPTEEESE